MHRARRRVGELLADRQQHLLRVDRQELGQQPADQRSSNGADTTDDCSDEQPDRELKWKGVGTDECCRQPVQRARDSGVGRAECKCERFVVADVDPERRRRQLTVAHRAPGPTGAVAQDIARQEKQRTRNR